MPSMESQERTSKQRVHRTEAAESSGTASSTQAGRFRLASWAMAGALFLAGTAAGVSSRWWLPQLPTGNGPNTSTNDAATTDQCDAAPADPQNHAAGQALALSPQGRKNIGLTLATVELQDFSRTVSMPATIVGRPGQSELAVAAPMTGIVTRIYAIRGEAVLPGAPLFDLRLTHEDLVEKQSTLLRSLEELDVVIREVARLEHVTSSGAVAGKRLLERQYEQQKTEATIRAERQALLLHGLTEDQINQIVTDRELIKLLTVVAPTLADDDTTDEHVEYLQVATISVKMGEHVATGTQLAAVSHHCDLLVEGRAFEHDAKALNDAANSKADVTALINVGSNETLAVPGLHILYVENQVERDSRALKFFVRLPNELVRSEQTGDGQRFIGWKYRPGQRVELMIPVERWENRIVLPIEAVIQEGPEAYVYLEYSGHFDRKEVHVEYRDQRHAVIESDGTLFPGDKVAAKGAYQIHLAMKNLAGGGVDPHAGHNH